MTARSNYVLSLIQRITLLAPFLVGAALAQPLAELAPAETVLALGYQAQPGVMETLDDDLAALDWEGARQTLEQLALSLGESFSDDMTGGASEALELFDIFSGSAGLLDEFTAECPQSAEIVAHADFDLLGSEALFALSASAFNPVPAFTALARLEPAAAAQAERLQAALVECAGEDAVTLEQDGVPLYVLGDGSDLPLVVGHLDEVFFVSSNPDVLRGVIRRAQGSSEPSLAGTELHRRAADTLEQGGVSFSLNLAALAEIAEGFRGMLGGGPETEYLYDRVTAMLRTLQGVAGNLSMTSEGLLLESVTAVNPQGGDSELAELLLCRNCRVSRPALVPAGTSSVSGSILPLRDVFRYLQGWLDGAESFLGEGLDLRTLLREEFGFDIDTALFDWIGNEVYVLGLEPFSTDLRSLLYGRPRLLMVPVGDPAAARAGLEHWGEALAPFADELFREFGDGEDAAEIDILSSGFASRAYTYRDIEITRLQASVNIDIGMAFVGGYLAVGTPARSLEALIDTFRGGPSMLGNPVLTGLPSQVLSFHVGDTQANVQGLADLLGIVSQPVAFGITAALATANTDAAVVQEGTEDLEFVEPLDPSDLAGVTPTPLTPQDQLRVEDALVADAQDDGQLAAFYELQGLSAGDRVTLELTSDDFDTYLYLIDADDASYLAVNDDAPDTSRSELSFTAQEGVRYWVEVTSWESATGNLDDFGGGTGDFALSVSRAAAEAPRAVVEPPSFADLLGLTEILPRALEVLAGHLSTSEGYTEIRGDSVYRRSLTRVDW